MLRRPVPWPDGAKVAVAVTFDMDADSLVQIAHPRDSITRVSTISILKYYGKTPEVFAGILTIGIIGLASDQLIRAGHRRAFRSSPEPGRGDEQRYGGHRGSRGDETLRRPARRRNRCGRAVVALDRQGEFVVFVGPSGCGKATVMRMIGGLETPSAGAILLQGQEITGPSREKGMVFSPIRRSPGSRCSAMCASSAAVFLAGPGATTS
jgi:hypothetical protein